MIRSEPFTDDELAARREVVALCEACSCVSRCVEARYLDTIDKLKAGNTYHHTLYCCDSCGRETTIHRVGDHCRTCGKGHIISLTPADLDPRQ